MSKLSKGILVIIVLTFAKSYSQSRKVADRYFKEFSYVKAAELYKTLYYNYGDKSKHVVSRLGDAYYNNVNTEEAEFWYEKLIADYKTEVSDAYLFKYAQVLKSNEKKIKSDSILSLIPFSKRNRFLKKEEYSDSKELFIGKLNRVNINKLSINSKYSDYGGFILNDEVYFSSSSITKGKVQKRYGWNEQPFLNIYKAKFSVGRKGLESQDTILSLYNSQPLKGGVTTEYHEGRPVFTRDGKTMYFTRNSFDGKRLDAGKKRTVHLKIFKAKLVNNIWTNVTELPFNNKRYSVGHPALSLDEKTLYFVSDMPGGYGKTDIYSVKIIGKDNYGDPVNLGSLINTSEREVFPFVGSDSTLYFSSDGHLGLGLLDIFKTKITSKNMLSSVQNLGEPFNSRKDDIAFYLHSNKKYGFFSSNREENDDDIYSFFLQEDFPCELSLKGYVFNDKTNEPIHEATVSIFNQKGEIIEEILTNTQGAYKIPKIICGSVYNLRAHKFDYKASQKEVDVKSKDLVDNVNFLLTPLVVDNQIVINPIHFDLDKYDIREDAKYELENIYTTMVNHPEIIIRIESHTDSRGPSSYNLILSEKRAIATKNYLIQRGINPLRIRDSKGYGESRLLNNCTDENLKCTEQEHAINRRSYFFIVEGMEAIKNREVIEKLRIKEEIEIRRKRIKELRKRD